MAGKCSACGAPMEGNICAYCGSAAEKPAGPAPYTNAAPPPVVVYSPPINIYNQPVSNADMHGPPINFMNAPPRISGKSKSVALILCILLGAIGAHRFYVGKGGTGILYLFTVGFFGLGWFIDVILIATGSFKDSFGLPLRQ